jgi:hypothetical protein
VHVVAPGLYAWALTVAEPAFIHASRPEARAAALVALVFLFAGAGLVVTRPGWSRAFGVYGFVAASLVTWLLVGDGLAPRRVDPISATLGALGWMLFVFGWGAPRAVGSVPEDDPHVVPGAPLVPRERIARGAGLMFAAALVAAAVLVVSAWRVVRGDHALFAHAAAVIASIGLVEAGVRVAADRGRREAPPPPRLRFARASWTLLAWVALVLLGLAYVWFR